MNYGKKRLSSAVNSKLLAVLLKYTFPKSISLDLKKLNLCVELEVNSDITADIEIISSEGKSARTDWQVLRSGKTSLTFDLSRMDLAAGTENIRVWQKPWYALRIHLASGPGCEIIIYDLFVRGWLEEVSNEKINLYECSNLPLSMESKPVSCLRRVVHILQYALQNVRENSSWRKRA